MYTLSIVRYSPDVMDQHEPGTMRSDLVKTVYRTWVLNELLENEISEPVGRGIRNDPGSSSGGSRAPWSSQVAELVMDLHAESRALEGMLSVSAFGSWPVRGWSSRNTWLALYRLTDLMEAVTERDVLTALLSLNRWVGRVEVVLGQAEPIRRLPRNFGQGEPVCPWCSYMTLRCHVLRGVVFCINPMCTDPGGNHPQAVLGANELGTLTLTWQDGTRRVPEPYREEAA